MRGFRKRDNMTNKKEIIVNFCNNRKIALRYITPEDHSTWQFGTPYKNNNIFDLNELEQKINKSSKIKVTISDIIDAWNELVIYKKYNMDNNSDTNKED